MSPIRIASLLMVGFLLTVTVPEAVAQRRGGPGGPGGSRFFDFVDANKDGKLDPTEAKRLPSPMREGLEKAGVDLSKTLTKEQLSEAMKKMMENRDRGDDRGGDRGRGSYRGGGDDDRGGDRRSEGDRRGDDRRRDDRRSDDRGGDDRGGDDRKSDDRRREPTPRKTFTPRSGVRVTLDLPDEFAEGDTNVDGQIGFYEWKKWKRGYAEFHSHDINGDGFITPREFAMTPLVVVEPSDGDESTDADGKAPDDADAMESTEKDAGNDKDPLKTVDVDEADPAKVKDAKYKFSLLDNDKDGQVTLGEWSASRSIRPKFEKAGIDLNQPMEEKRFVEIYLTVNK